MMESNNFANESGCLQKFRLYETRSKFYMVGRDKSRRLWKILKIDRSDPSELNIREDSANYSASECTDVLMRVNEGNKSTGGLKFVTSCYGIVGFVKFLGPYYMLLITKRRQIGVICGHMVYAVTRSEIIALPNSYAQSSVAVSKNEHRYKKLLCSVDLTKDFFFSYSYNVMCSLQKNMCNRQTGQVLYETMFVWNEFLTRGIRNHLKSTVWTVALVHGFFKQAALSVSGKDFMLTLIARRSRYYAGTRYLKRGVNEKGRVANDVETEQIVFEDNIEGIPTQISSVVQNRGSIPLFWSQETSRLNLKPDIVLHKKDINYKATRLHFENLVKRYGNPIIILNLIKTREKKPRESILRAEFANAIDVINKDLSEENHLKFLHWDLHKHSRSKAANVLALLRRAASHALNLTGFFYCQVPPSLSLEDGPKWPVILKGNADELVDSNHLDEDNLDGVVIAENGSDGDNAANSDRSETAVDNSEVRVIKPPKIQQGALRTNCIDCLDRTNVAQYAFGLAALGHQLHALGIIDYPRVDLDSPLANDLMRFYEKMGDTLALQYGGSAAHNKIFSETRGQWKAAIQSQEFFRTLQRYYNNAYMDAEKQDAINLFLGYFQPQVGKPAIWELGSDQHYNVRRRGNGFEDENAWSIMKRSLSDGNILRENNTPVRRQNAGEKKLPNSSTFEWPYQEEDALDLSASTPEISACKSDISFSRCTTTMPHRHIYGENEHICSSEHMSYESSSSNFLDLEWLSSLGNSCEEEIFDRYTTTNSLTGDLSTENVIDSLTANTSSHLSENGSSMKGKDSSVMHSFNNDAGQSSDRLGEFSERFVRWVINGEMLCY
ncbi:phosphoinositide phosphatase SAC2-like [Iris pallida]|uniref:Phosphoinositide phosphatase SAC2-like n=1 Tax=Iris pallida TaxID=29817 RepID=A0AAX6G9Q6_IRIPA|nr:phosphoinositide phosphatase SAC2-like [Iris pallida]